MKPTRSTSPFRSNLILFHIVAIIFLQTQFVYAVPSFGQHLVIAGPQRRAVEAGLEIARAGGNVVDAAIATELALAVTTPYFAALGGGGFAVVKMNGQVNTLDFREMGPAATHADFFKDKPKEAARTGGAAVGVPGVPAGLKALHEKYGKLKWSQLFEPAIRLAQKGFEVSGEWNEHTEDTATRFNSAGKAIFLTAKGSENKPAAPLPGDLFKQPKLAALLSEMRNRGPIVFYEGLAARDIVDSVKKSGGVMTLEDLKNYKVRWLAPLQSDIYGFHFYFMPPPSSGGIIVESALKLSELKKLETRLPQSAEELHFMGEILKGAFRGRTLLGDPDFTKNPLEQLLAPSFLKGIADQIQDKKIATFKAFGDDQFKGAHESDETTHFSIMDKDGNAVAFTVTLNGEYGSAVVSEKYGIALNNEMDDFTTKAGEPNQFGLIQGSANAVGPGKRPLSSMSPTIVEKDGKTVLSVGSPGGPRIISAVYQVIYRALISKYDMDESIQTVRVHHQFDPDILYIDQHKLSPDVVDTLKKWGHTIKESHVAKVYGVKYNFERQVLEGAFDARGEGFAAGY